MKYEIELNSNEPNTIVNFDDYEDLAFELKLRTIDEQQLYVDIEINNEIICYGRRCCNKMPLLLTNKYNGNLYFKDEYGDNDPVYSDFNTRYKLIWDTDYVL